MSQATNASATPATATAPAKTPAQVEAEAIAKAELALVAKYGEKIVVGSVQRAPEGSKYGKKLLVTINTRGVDGEFDGQTREIASSDVFQVHHTEAVAALVRKARAADKRAAAKADREAAPAKEGSTLDLLGL